MSGNKFLHALQRGGPVKGQVLVELGPVLIVIGDADPGTPFVLDGTQRHTGTTDHLGIFQCQCRLEPVVGIIQQGITLMTAPGGNIIGGAACGAIFGPETIIAKFTMSIVIL